MKGYFTLVLHSHLPFVHHPGSDDFIEERWLYEAMTETYLPLLQTFDRLEEDGIPFRITMSLSPTLLTMLENEEMKDKYNQFLDNLIALSDREMERNAGDSATRSLAEYYRVKFISLKDRFNITYKRSIVQSFKRFQDSGCLELITCAATHAFLPYIKTEQALRSQIENAVKLHTSLFEKAPKGIWLPECGYVENIESVLESYGINYFFIDSHAIQQATPPPAYGVYQPVRIGNGVFAFGREPETSKQVWSSIEGYPGDYHYREYYKDIGFELDYDYIKPFLHKSGIRLNTGIKYWRVTGEGADKALYDPQQAAQKAYEHACDFINKQIHRSNEFSNSKGITPIIVSSYDTELFGHWWYEGPLWIDSLFRHLCERGEEGIIPITPSEYIYKNENNFDAVSLYFSSWGKGGYGEVWLDHSNEWLYRHLHEMEEQLIYLSTKYGGASVLTDRALNQAARELMLAQSSDWAFIMHHRSVVDYAMKRTKNHIGRFHAISDRIKNDTLSLQWVTELERLDSVFSELDYSVYVNPTDSVQTHSDKKLKVLMLSWEYPPMTVGGLSRHVFDLTRHLAIQGVEVHVVTSHVEGYPPYEINQSVHVHRVKTLQSHELDFMEWVFQLNMAMVDYVENMSKWYGSFDVLHAHDWLVGYAARFVTGELKLPLVTTIHATEHGRNNGIHSPLQRKIHDVESDLANVSSRVIVCSEYMEKEVMRLFSVQAGNVVTIPNGVDPSMVQVEAPDVHFRDRYALPEEKIVFFVGRLVQEKGVDTLLESVPLILNHCPEAKFIIAGKGPMLNQWLEKSKQLKIQEKVLFCGFIDDDTRNQLLHYSAVAVFPSYYEPFGIVALEAMAAGVPVVASGVGGLSEVITHGIDGFTVLPGNVDSLASHIVVALQEKDRVEEMVQNALFKVYTTYSWDRIAGQTIDIYNRAVAEVLNAHVLHTDRGD